MDTAVPDGLETATRRLVAAQLALIAGPPGLRDQVRALSAGTLGTDEAVTAIADLDRIADLLIPAG